MIWNLFGLVFLFLLLVLQYLKRRNILKSCLTFKIILIALVLWIFLRYLTLTYLQYLAWDSNVLTQYFLPPYTSFAYLLQYHFVRFLMYPLISGVVALVFYLGAKHGNGKYQNKFFEPEELFIVPAVVLALNSDSIKFGWLYLFFLVGILYLVTHFILLVKNLKNKAPNAMSLARLPLYWYWVPTGLLVFWLSYIVTLKSW